MKTEKLLIIEQWIVWQSFFEYLKENFLNLFPLLANFGSAIWSNLYTHVFTSVSQMMQLYITKPVFQKQQSELYYVIFSYNSYILFVLLAFWLSFIYFTFLKVKTKSYFHCYFYSIVCVLLFLFIKETERYEERKKKIPFQWRSIYTRMKCFP